MPGKRNVKAKSDSNKAFLTTFIIMTVTFVIGLGIKMYEWTTQQNEQRRKIEEFLQERDENLKQIFERREEFNKEQRERSE